MWDPYYNSFGHLTRVGTGTPRPISPTNGACTDSPDWIAHGRPWETYIELTGVVGTLGVRLRRRAVSGQEPHPNKRQS